MYRDVNIVERQRRGDWMQTFTGRAYWPCDPLPSDVYIGDIAHALARLCRFNGHVIVPHYSVAEHSVRCSRIVESNLALAALLHDAAEAYVADVPNARAVGRAFGVELVNLHPDVKRAVAAQFQSCDFGGF